MDLITWNMQGGSAPDEQKWNTGVKNMMGNTPGLRPEYLCLQEAGAVPPSAGQPQKRKNSGIR